VTRTQLTLAVCAIAAALVPARLQFRAIVLAAVLTLTVGTTFYRFTEGWSTLNSLYFCVTTLTTIGFGDDTPKTALGKTFTIIYVFIGLGILGGFIHALFEASARDRRKD
jgi:hypothetical protein